MAIKFKTKDVVAEGVASLTPGPIFAATHAKFCLLSDRIKDPASYVPASLQPSKSTRRKYLYLRDSGVDPLVAVRHSAGRVDLRVFPVVKEHTVTVLVDGYVLLTRHHTGTRVYGDNARCMIVSKDGGIRFVDRTDVKDAVIDIPCVAALETAFTGKGDKAVSADVALGYLVYPPDGIFERPRGIPPPPPPPASVDAPVKRSRAKPASSTEDG